MKWSMKGENFSVEVDVFPLKTFKHHKYCLHYVILVCNLVFPPKRSAS